MTPKVAVLNDYREPSDELVCLPDGEYEATYVGHRCVFVFRVWKVRVDFRLLARPGITLARWYRATVSRSRISAIGTSSDLVRELSAVVGKRVRRDRIPVGEFANHAVRVQVKTVTTDRNQRELAKVNKYSVIECVLGCVR